MRKMSEPKICLCKDTMIKLFKHLQKTKSGKTLWQLIAKRTRNQFPMRKPRRMILPISPIALAMADPTSRALGFGRRKPIKTMRKKPRTPNQKAATRKLIAFNKKRFK